MPKDSFHTACHVVQMSTPWYMTEQHKKHSQASTRILPASSSVLQLSSPFMALKQLTYALIGRQSGQGTVSITQSE
jgi:hypothetical protein